MLGSRFAAMDEKKASKPSFWRFGGSLDRLYIWLVGLFFVLSCFDQIRSYKGHLPGALGTATGQTVWVALVLFVFLKAFSGPTRKP